MSIIRQVGGFMLRTKNTVFLALGLALPLSVAAQQWSSDPLADHLKQLEANIIKAQAFMNWCEEPENRHEEKCSGVNAREASHTKFVTWEEAMKLSGEKPVSQKPVSLGDSARQFRIQKLQRKLEPLIADFCKKNPATKTCSLANPSLIARQLSEKYDGYEANLVASPDKEK
jgi:hypothetical protein